MVKFRAVTADDVTNFLIRKNTKSKFSHVEFLLDQDWHDFILGLSTQQPPLLAWQNLALKQIRDLHLGDYGALGSHLSGGVAIRATSYGNYSLQQEFQYLCNDDQKRKIMKFALSQIGDKYCIKTIVGDLLGRSLQEPNEFDCSVFLNDAFGQVQYLQNPIDGPDLVTPRDCAMSVLANPV